MTITMMYKKKKTQMIVNRGQNKFETGIGRLRTIVRATSPFLRNMKTKYKLQSIIVDKIK